MLISVEQHASVTAITFLSGTSTLKSNKQGILAFFGSIANITLNDNSLNITFVIGYFGQIIQFNPSCTGLLELRQTLGGGVVADMSYHQKIPRYG